MNVSSLICDYCGRAVRSDAHTGATIVPIEARGWFYVARNNHIADAADFCSYDCLAGWATEKAKEAEQDSLLDRERGAAGSTPRPVSRVGVTY